MCVWVCRFFFLLFTWHFLFAPFPFFIFLSLIRPCSCECVFAYFEKLLIPGGCLKIQSIVYVCLCIKCFLTAKKKQTWVIVSHSIHILAHFGCKMMWTDTMLYTFSFLCERFILLFPVICTPFWGVRIKNEWR